MILITFLFDIVLIWWWEILSWSLMGAKGLKTSVSWLEADKWCVASYKATSKELNSGQLRPNPVRSRVKGLNSGPLDYKPILFIMIFLSFWCGTNCPIFHNWFQTRKALSCICGQVKQPVGCWYQHRGDKGCWIYFYSKFWKGDV